MQAKSFKELISPNKASAFSTHLQKENPQLQRNRNFNNIEKFNPYHDRLGRFASASGATSFTYSPGKSKAHDMAIARQKEQHASRMPTAAQAKTLKEIERKTRNLKNEQLRVVDRDGNVILHKKGDSGSVSCTLGEARETVPGNIHIHNHPNKYIGGTFSPDDLSTLGHNPTEMRAVAKEGTYILREINPHRVLQLGDKSWVDMKQDVEKILSDTPSSPYKLKQAAKKSLEDDPTVKKINQKLDDNSNKMGKLMQQGKRDEALKILEESDALREQLRPIVEHKARELVVQPLHEFYKTNAYKYGYEYEFIPYTGKVKKSMIDDIEDINESVKKTNDDLVLDGKFNTYIDDLVDDIMNDLFKNPINTAKSFADILKFNPYHDRLGRFSSSGSAASFTYKPGASTAHSKAIEREKEKDSQEGKGFKGTLYHGSPNKDIKEFDMKRAGQNTSSGEKLLFFTDSKQMADDFSYERLEGSSKFFQERGKKGRVYEVDVEMKNPLDLRKLNDKDIDNILKLDEEGILTKDMVQRYANSNHQLLKAGLTLTSESLKNLGYDGLIANTGKAGHNSIEYAVVDSKQAKIKKSIASGGENLNDDINKADKEKYALYIGLNVTGAEHLAMDGGEDPKDFHVTLLYGYYHPVSDVEDTAMRIQSCREKAVKYLPDTLKLDAIGRFEASDSSDDKDVIYARVAPGQLEKAHDILLKELNNRGLKVQPTFDEYHPHMTLKYIDPDEEVELKDIDETVTIKNLTEGFETDEASSKENENTFKIAKTDDDKRLVFGWALVAKDKDGNVIKDHQNDIVEENELEEGAYEYVLNFRDCGEEHIPGLRKKARMVESCVFTEEKQKALGIPKGTVPTGWWIGFYVDDDKAWEKIKDGTYKMFSIEGKAIRVPVDEVQTTDTLTKSDNVAKTFAEILKFNPYHDRLGRFTSGGGFMASGYTGDKSRQAVTFSANPDTRAGALAIERARGHHP